jgi:hypothetical protein
VRLLFAVASGTLIPGHLFDHSVDMDDRFVNRWQRGSA